LIRKIFNFLGFHTNNKLIIFISDDWGGLRIRSKEARENLIKLGIDMETNRFNRYDMLESNSDLEELFEVLLKYKDCKGNHPIITAAVNVANPDFEKISENNFSEYFYEPFTKTLERYPESDRVFLLYKRGIELNIFRPEFHGREHLNIKWWLENLKSGNKIFLEAFRNEYWYVPVKNLLNVSISNLGAAFDIYMLDEIGQQKNIINDGVKVFNDIFNYNPILFVPPAQYYNERLEEAIANCGFKMIDVPHLHKMPLGYGKFKTKLHYMGQKNKYGLKYLIRNVVFEPNMYDNSNCIDGCIAGIENAFRYHKPAIISNHRAAFIGGLDLKNRAKGLKALDLLFSKILKRWPEVEFLSAASFLQIY